MQFRVDKAVFEKFRGLVVGLVVARGIDNSEDPDEAASFLGEQIMIARNTWSHERLASDPRIQSWRNAYRAFRAKPKKHYCSAESLYRIILSGGEIPSINTAVDVYNAISLKYCVPIGGDDLDQVAGDILLTFAKGDERFVPLNGTELMPPRTGEVIYRDDEEVLCRRWNWRECDKSKMTDRSRNLCLVVEGLPPVSEADVERVSTELGSGIERFCGGSIDIHLVKVSHMGIEL